jgi:hypothetical protein
MLIASLAFELFLLLGSESWVPDLKAYSQSLANGLAHSRHLLNKLRLLNKTYGFPLFS